MNIFDLSRKFSTPEKAVKYFESIRWKDKVVCPYCKSDKTCKHQEKGKKRWQCWNCCKSFSATVGTIFHHTHIPLNKWFMLMALMLNAKKGLSSCQASRDIGIQQKTVWSMMHRIRKAMETDQAQLLRDVVEMDETYIGGKPRKGNDKDDDDDKPSSPRGRGTKKTPVVGMVERGGSVKTVATSKFELKGKDLKKFVRKYIDLEETILVTDEYKGYLGMRSLICHLSVNHQKTYADGDIHTNTIESFWAILKRGMIGQFHKVSKKYLENYLHEFEYRYNRRNADNGVTFETLLGRMCQST